MALSLLQRGGCPARCAKGATSQWSASARLIGWGTNWASESCWGRQEAGREGFRFGKCLMPPLGLLNLNGFYPFLFPETLMSKRRGLEVGLQDPGISIKILNQLFYPSFLFFFFLSLNKRYVTYSKSISVPWFPIYSMRTGSSSWKWS